MRFRASDVARVANGVLTGPDRVLEGAGFDSRILAAGQLFVPLVPPIADHDGHRYITAAIDAGAGGYLTARPPRGGTAIEVADTLNAYMRLGAWAREQLTDSVVGITGSVGKTSVKDMVKSVLTRRWRTHANEKSFNNEFGLPTTILNAPDDTQVLVTEMGMRGFGEIARLCAVAQPSIGVVTRVAEAHSGRVGGIEGVRRAKAELIASLPAYGTAVLNADDHRVASMTEFTAARCLTFGLTGDVRVVDLTLDELARPTFVLATDWGTASVRLPVAGAHMAINAAAAAAIGLVLDVSLDDVVAGLEATEMAVMRMAMVRLESGGLVLDDSYNANPTSMRAALEALAALPDVRRRRAVLGVMAEIEDAAHEHAAIAAFAHERGITVLAVATELYGVPSVATPADAVEWLGSTGPGDAILVKGSRIAALERVTGLLQEVAHR